MHVKTDFWSYSFILKNYSFIVREKKQKVDWSYIRMSTYNSRSLSDKTYPFFFALLCMILLSSLVTLLFLDKVIIKINSVEKIHVASI